MGKITSDLESYRIAERKRFFVGSEKLGATQYSGKVSETGVELFRGDFSIAAEDAEKIDAAATRAKSCRVGGELTRKKSESEIHYLQNKLLAISAIYSRWLVEGGSSEEADKAMLAVGEILNSFESVNGGGFSKEKKVDNA